MQQQQQAQQAQQPLAGSEPASATDSHPGASQPTTQARACTSSRGAAPHAPHGMSTRQRSGGPRKTYCDGDAEDSDGGGFEFAQSPQLALGVDPPGPATPMPPTPLTTRARYWSACVL